MAIADIAQYAHLTQADIEELAYELDAIRTDVEESRGARDAAYIRRTIAFQRVLEAASRVAIAGTRSRAGWIAGTTALAFAKSVENMEIGHNVGHGQWDWMNDPEIHSNTWEWDMAGVSSQWRYSHNYRHHVLTNVVGEDDDVGFGVIRVTRDQPWERRHAWQPLRHLFLGLMFEWGIARHGLHAQNDRAISDAEKAEAARALNDKMKRQLIKDYVTFPALSLKRWRRTLGANAVANLMRNVWSYMVIFCGHFPDGAEKFTAATLEQETRGEWYLRQMLGSANFKAGRFMAFASGNLCYQIEHHLFPDLPSNRYRQIAERVRPLCDKYDLPYTTGSLLRQYWLTFRTINKLALPDRFLTADCNEAPETASEHMTPRALEGARGQSSGTRRQGLRTAWQQSRFR
jgi:fatty acid desaturase